MRITRPGLRALYVIVFVGIAGGLSFSASSLDDGVVLRIVEIVRLVWLPLGVFVGIRTFRGSNEEVAPPRPSWRWTARPTAGRWLAAYFLLATVLPIFGVVATIGRNPGAAAGLWITYLGLLSTLVIGLGYLNSSIRLARRPDLAPPTPRSRAALDPATLPADRRPERP